jgi:GGDEF domain-containing protein
VHAVEDIVEAERIRSGGADKVSGAYGRLALTQGTLLKEEYDHSTHFFAQGAVLGALICDTVGLIHLNMQYGFKVVDGVLAAQVRALKALCPRGKVVRIHGDAFAAVLGPTADQRVEDVTGVEAALEKATREALGAHDGALTFTVARLELRVKDPPNHDVLGPLLWGECERALVLAKRGDSALQRRFVDFNATV